jgi:hypothetical protein
MWLTGLKIEGTMLPTQTEEGRATANCFSVWIPSPISKGFTVPGGFGTLTGLSGTFCYAPSLSSQGATHIASLPCLLGGRNQPALPSHRDTVSISVVGCEAVAQ